MNEHYQPVYAEEPIAGLPIGMPAIRGVSAVSCDRRIGVLAVEQRVLCNGGEADGIAFEESRGDDSPRWTTSIITCGGAVELMRAIFSTQEDYLVFSPRTGLIWDCHLVHRIKQEIAAFEALGVPWFCLSADGKAFDGAQYAAAFFNNEPSIIPDRGRRLIVQSAGTVYAVNVSALRTLGVQRIAGADIVSLLNNLIIIAYGRGFGSFFTSGLYPCIEESRCLSYVEIGEQLISLNLSALLHPVDAYELFPADVSRPNLVGAWLETLSSALSVKHPFSFVIRTLFRRPHLLRRCLISIEYIRRSLGVPVEIILASDVDESVLKPALHELSVEFPHMTFVTADGRKGNGHSRVRNLIAGLQRASGTRVCIIDDDDYYTTEAVGSFAKSCEFGTEQLVIFDTQIVVEKWTSVGVKHHKEIMQYGRLYDAKSWATTLRGSNSIPLCGIIHPGWFIREIAEQYVYDFDLSEDFVFHLVCLTHPRRPPIRIVDAVGAFQSHRADGDNVSTVADRTNWVLDTGNGLYQLLCVEGRTFDVIAAGEVIAGEVNAHEKVRDLQAELVRSRKANVQATEALARMIGMALNGSIS
jgi:energy-coupling factor transporter ATP-binding protein EcfA2